MPKKGFIKGNKYIECDDYYLGYVSNGKSFKVNKQDIPRVSQHTWATNSQDYIGTYIDHKYISLHRFVTNADDGFEVDHINHDVTDNRQENLRVCTKNQNQHNTNLRKDNISGVKGVNWKDKLKKWRAYIQVDKKLIHLGYFKNIEDAIKTRLEAEVEYFGEFRTQLTGGQYE